LRWFTISPSLGCIIVSAVCFASPGLDELSLVGQRLILPVFRYTDITFHVDSIIAFLSFNAINLGALLLLLGSS